MQTHIEIYLPKSISKRLHKSLSSFKLFESVVLVESIHPKMAMSLTITLGIIILGLIDEGKEVLVDGKKLDLSDFKVDLAEKRGRDFLQIEEIPQNIPSILVLNQQAEKYSISIEELILKFFLIVFKMQEVFAQGKVVYLDDLRLGD